MDSVKILLRSRLSVRQRTRPEAGHGARSRSRRWGGAATVLLLLWTSPVFAQEQEPPFPKYAVGVYSGGIFFSDLTSGGETRADLSLEPGFVVGMQAETWVNPQIALRMNGSYTDRPFKLGGDRQLGGGFGESQLFDGTFGDVNVWLADMSVMYRVLSPKGSRRMAPFVTAGPGLAHYNPAGKEGRSIAEADVRFDKETRFAAVGGMGLDILPNTPTKKFGAFIRMELVDYYVFDSPAKQLSSPSASGNGGFDGVHNLRLNLGMNLIFPLQPSSCACR